MDIIWNVLLSLCMLLYFAFTDGNTKPSLTCPDFVTVEVSSRESATYNILNDVKVSGGQLEMSPSLVTVTVEKIGTAQTVIGKVTDPYGNEASCVFMMNFIASACFPEQLFDDNNAVRTCTEDDGSLVCTSTCRSNYLYSDRSNQKNFTCAGNGTWKYLNTIPNERFCLEKQNPEYEVYLYLKHNLTTIAGSCVTQYKAALQTNVGTFRKAIANICEGQQWLVSLITAEAADGLFEFEANFKLTLLSLSAGSNPRQMCLDKVSEQVFRLPNNQLNCNGMQNILPVDNSVIKGEREQTCLSIAFELVGDVCLSNGPGQYFDIDTNSRASCPDGKYQDGLAQTSCKTCPAGQYPNSDRTRCQVTCSDGFVSFSGFYPCKPCPVDHYWTAKDTCTACPGDSSTVGKEGASDISQCNDPEITTGANEPPKSVNTTLIVGITLGVVCVLLGIVAVYFIKETYTLRRRARKIPDSTTNNSQFISNATRGHELNTAAPYGEVTTPQYTDLTRYANIDADTYDDIHRI